MSLLIISGNRICNLYRLVVDATFLQVVQQALARVAAYTALIVTILVIPAIVDGDVIGLAWYEVEVNPCGAERTVREDAAYATGTGLIELCLPFEALVDNRHTGHVVIITDVDAFV